MNTSRLTIALFLALVFSTELQAGDYSRALLDIGERLHLQQDGGGVFPGTRVHEPALVGAFYDARDFRPAWTDIDYVDEMLAVLRDSSIEGLNPEDYHYSELLTLRESYTRDWSDEDAVHARAEVLLTDGILLYARHLLEGKVDPRTLDSTWNYDRREFSAEDVAASLAAAIASREVTQSLDALKLDLRFYRMMKEQLGRYRELARAERFEPLPDDRVLHPGDRGAEVVGLRRRLHQMGYLDAMDGDNSLFDAPLEAAVRELQSDNGLGVDGVVGRQSYALLNLSYRDKVDLLRLNMDRLRWIGQQLSDEFIVVNIAGFELYYLRDRELFWETPVMVGSISTRTPIFQAPLRYLEFNPTWNAPRSLVSRSVFPKVSANPQYAIDKKYRFYDGAGKEVDPLALDYSAYSAERFPFRVVQMPGPANAMGQVKFMFPNPHAVYLHDTPSRELFSRKQRAFSAGCIRVKNPLELARLLLDDPVEWSAEKIQALLDSGAPQQVARIRRPIDVMLMYWTVSPLAGGRLQFHHDIYGLDPAALAALDAAPGATTIAP